MRSKGGSKTKERLIKEAFKLFVQKPYDKVTFSDLEEITGLSRGAILYYFKKKEHMYDLALKTYVFSFSSNLIIAKNGIYNTFAEFIDLFIIQIRNQERFFNELGINNMNRAMMNLESQAFYFFPQIIEYSKQWHDQEIITWRDLLDKFIATGEIKNSINVEKTAKIFENLYLGISYSGVTTVNGCDIDDMRDQLFEVYSMIKN